MRVGGDEVEAAERGGDVVMPARPPSSLEVGADHPAVLAAGTRLAGALLSGGDSATARMGFEECVQGWAALSDPREYWCSAGLELCTCTETGAYEDFDVELHPAFHSSGRGPPRQ